MRAGLALLALALPLAGCGTPPPPVTPIDGSIPSNVMLIPTVDHTKNRQVVAALDATLHGEMIDRGYYAIPVEVSLRILAKLGWSPERAPLESLPRERLHLEFGVDAILTTEVNSWGEGVEANSIAVDIRWQLIGASDGAVLWSHEEHGRRRPQPRRAVEGPFFSDEPVLGRDFGRWTTETGEHDDEVPALLVQRGMAARLPLGPHHPDFQSVR